MGLVAVKRARRGSMYIIYTQATRCTADVAVIYPIALTKPPTSISAHICLPTSVCIPRCVVAMETYLWGTWRWPLRRARMTLPRAERLRACDPSLLLPQLPRSTRCSRLRPPATTITWYWWSTGGKRTDSNGRNHMAVIYICYYMLIYMKHFSINFNVSSAH